MEPTSPSPRPLKASEVALLAYLRAVGDVEGCSTQTKEAIADGTGLSRSTVAVAASGLADLGLLAVETSAGRAPNVYCVQPSDQPSDQPSEPSDSTVRFNRPEPSDQPSEPSDSLPVDAPGPAPAGERPGGSPPLTPSPGVSGSPFPEGRSRVGERPPAREPSDSQPSDPNRPIGSLAVAEAMTAARAAGRSIEPALRARIGNAAQNLSKDESVETILAAARRLGEGGFSDLYTAARAVDRGAPPPAPAAAPVPDGSRLAEVVRLVRATWPRAVIDVAVWERELEKIPTRFLVEGVRALAKEGGEFAPHWGQVYRKSWRIGVDETERRRSARERADLRARVDAIESGS